MTGVRRKCSPSPPAPTETTSAKAAAAAAEHQPLRARRMPERRQWTHQATNSTVVSRTDAASQLRHPIERSRDAQGQQPDTAWHL
jgi:hypothetical protein